MESEGQRDTKRFIQRLRKTEHRHRYRKGQGEGGGPGRMMGMVTRGRSGLQTGRRGPALPTPRLQA